MRLGLAHHFGWAVAVTASADHEVVDRRRIALIEPGMPAAPIHHEGSPHLLHRRAEPLDDDALAALVAEVARKRGWDVHFYDAKRVEADAAHILGVRAHDVLHGPRTTLGPPWSKDHRVALAATVVVT